MTHAGEHHRVRSAGQHAARGNGDGGSGNHFRLRHDRRGDDLGPLLGDHAHDLGGDLLIGCGDEDAQGPLGSSGRLVGVLDGGRVPQRSITQGPGVLDDAATGVP